MTLMCRLQLILLQNHS